MIRRDISDSTAISTRDSVRRICRPVVHHHDLVQLDVAGLGVDLELDRHEGARVGEAVAEMVMRMLEARRQAAGQLVARHTRHRDR